MTRFAIDISNFVDRTKEKLDLVVRKVTLEVFTGVIMRTPVETGRARGNWATAAAVIPSGFDPEKKDKGGAATVAAMTQIVGTMVAGDIMNLANSVPYILRLEEGHSGQAPAGMVVTTLKEHPAVVSRAARQARNS